MDSKLDLIQQSFNTRYSQWVREALDELPDNFTITDPTISGHPIVFASRGFLKMSGYSQEEVIGLNGKIFQGPKTNRRTVMEIREAIREERGIQINLLNYRKDGTPFWMLFHMSPVFGKEDGRVIHFVAVQVPVTRKQRRNWGGGSVWVRMARVWMRLCSGLVGRKSVPILCWNWVVFCPWIRVVKVRFLALSFMCSHSWLISCSCSYIWFN